MWIAQLASVPASAGIDQLQRTLEEIRIEIPGAQYLDSSDYASLNPGYWVVYYTGSFNDGNQALRYCASHSRPTRNQCVGRFLSHDIQDKSYICFPPADSQDKGCFKSTTTAFRTNFDIIGRRKWHEIRAFTSAMSGVSHGSSCGRRRLGQVPEAM
jgi:hypothetical protein